MHARHALDALQAHPLAGHGERLRSGSLAVVDKRGVSIELATTSFARARPGAVFRPAVFDCRLELTRTTDVPSVVHVRSANACFLGYGIVNPTKVAYSWREGRDTHEDDYEGNVQNGDDR